MNPEIKAKWLEALRSGRYKQGVEYLQGKDNTFCCLGVLCDLHNKEFDTEWRTTNCTHLYLNHTTLLPQEVSVWAGVKKERELMRMNDRGDSFSEIADYIEENL